MGAQLHGAARTVEECKDLRGTYTRAYFTFIENQLAKIKNTQPLREREFGVEIELVGVDDKYHFRAFDKEQFRPQYDPEILTCNVELVSEPKTHNGIDHLIEYIDELKAGVQGPSIQIGSHPQFNLSVATDYLNPLPRYQQLIRALGKTPTQFCVDTYGNSSYCSSGAQWEGVGTSFQFTVNTPLNEVAHFYNAAKKLAPIALYATASSPFIDGVLTNVQSVRSIIIPKVTSAEHRKWRSLEPLTHKLNGAAPYETRMHRQLKKFDPAVAKYFIESMREGWMLRVVGDEKNAVQPPPTFWPTVKLQGHIINENGIPIEVRTAEQLADTHDTVHYMLGMHSMIIQEAQMQQREITRATSGSADDHNTQLVNRGRNLYWDGKNVHPSEVVQRFLPGMKNLRKLGYSTSEITSVQQWWANRVNDATIMRRAALRKQPDLATGKPLTQETLEHILARHKL